MNVPVSENVNPVLVAPCASIHPLNSPSVELTPSAPVRLRMDDATATAVSSHRTARLQPISPASINVSVIQTAQISSRWKGDLLNLCRLCQYRPRRVSAVIATGSSSYDRSGNVDSACQVCMFNSSHLEIRAESHNLTGKLDSKAMEALTTGETWELQNKLTGAATAAVFRVEQACTNRKQAQLEIHPDPTAIMLVEQILATGEEIVSSLGVKAFDFKSADSGLVWNRPDGFLLLTNQRVICFTNSLQRNNTLVKTGTGDFSVNHNLSESKWLFPIPLTSFKHVSILSATVMSADTAISAQRSSCCCSICTCDCCMTITGFEVPSDATHGSQRVDMARSHTLQIALLMPPWDERSTLQVKIHNDVPLLAVEAFTARFHQLTNKQP